LYTTRQASRESAILVGVVLADEAVEDIDDSLNELELLADTAGADATDRLVQRVQQVHPATYIGKGKVQELKALVEQRKSDLVIFDDDLSPVQMRNIEREVNCKLVDRSALILDIFASHARTAVAKTQVELAQLEYLRTRLTRQWTHLSRQKGGIGTKGPGETQIETDRRLIGTRISTLKERLDKIDKQRTVQRKGRSKFTRVSLVGYTNAGKSTLMNALADEDVRAEDRLFATLDSTTRQVDLSANRQILLSDTVGFIRKLPHRLIESFKSTLDEVRESDVLLHVLDATHPRVDDQRRVVNETLAELDSHEKATLLVFNKIDAINDADRLAALRDAHPDAAFVSALRGIGLTELRTRLLEVIEEDFQHWTVFIPVSDQESIAWLRSIAEITSEEYLYAGTPWEDDTVAVARLQFRAAPRYRDDIAPLIRRYRDLTPVLSSP